MLQCYKYFFGNRGKSYTTEMARLADGFHPCWWHTLNPTQPHHKTKLNDVAVQEEKLCAPVLLTPPARPYSARVATNTHSLTRLIGEQHILQASQQEERVGAVKVEEYDPTNPCTAETDP